MRTFIAGGTCQGFGSEQEIETTSGALDLRSCTALLVVPSVRLRLCC